MIVTEPIYDVRESHNCPRTFATHFTCIHLERRFLFSIWCYKIVCPLTKGRWYSWCSVSCPPPLVQIPLSTFLRLSKLRLQRRKAIRELGPREAMGYLAFAPSSSVWALVSRLPIERLHRLYFIRQMLIFEKLVTWSETNGVHNLYALCEKNEIFLMEFREHLGKIEIKFLKIGIVLKSQYNIVTLK